MTRTSSPTGSLLRARRWLGSCSALVLLAPLLAAQAPKLGGYYEDKTELGFKVKVPKDWEFIPPQPGDKNLIGKYVAPNKNGIYVPGYEPWAYQAWLVKFDRRESEPKEDLPPKEGERRIEFPGFKDLESWLEPGVEVRAGWKRTSQEKLAVEGGLEAVEYRYTGKKDEQPLGLYVALYKLKPDLEVALVFNAPGEDKKWNKFEGPFRALAKTFKRGEVAAKDPAAGSKLGSGSLRAQKKAKLQDELTRLPGWTLYETPNYFVISNNPDKEFMEELKTRLEAIRKVYEETYPPSKAEELRNLAKAREAKKQAEEAAAGEGAAKEGDESGSDEPRTEAKPVDPMEASRTSVVRVLRDKAMYMNYGGMEQTAGYFSPMQEELIIFDDKAEGGRRDTWATLNHEAFHQYTFYFFGMLAPHYWYNEGTGDFYSGYQLKNNKFELKPFDWRERLIQGLLRGSGGEEEGTEGSSYVPLKTFVKYTREQYYDLKNNKKLAGNHYAQGWSLIYFLRTGAKKAQCWNPAWGSILDTYLRVLVETDDLDQAVDQAFAGVNWEELEKCWKEYILQG